MIPPRPFERDELEQLLQSNLQGFAPEASDELWADIEARLPKRRRRFAAWWWSGGILGACVLTIAATIWAGKSQEKTLNDTANKVSPTAQIGTAGHNSSEAKISSPTANGVSLNPHPVTKGGLKPHWRAETPVETEIQALSFASREVSVAQTGATDTYKPEVLPLASIVLPIPPVDVAVNRDIPLPQGRPYPVQGTLHPVKEPEWQIGCTVAPYWVWQRHHSAGVPLPGSLAFDQHHLGPASGRQAGIMVGKTLRRHWQLRAGGLVSSGAQRWEHDAELQLLDGVCINPDDPGPKVYEFRYTLQSGDAPSNLTVRIAQVDSMTNMPKDEPFMLHMSTTDRRVDWLFPLQLRRSFSLGRWTGFVEGGGALHIPGKQRVEVTHYSEVCAELCYEQHHTPILTIHTPRTVTFAWTFGAGVVYPLTSNWSIEFTPSVWGQTHQTGCSMTGGIYLRF